jgi:hypothetical protein
MDALDACNVGWGSRTNHDGEEEDSYSNAESRVNAKYGIVGGSTVESLTKFEGASGSCEGICELPAATLVPDISGTHFSSAAALHTMD